MEASVEIKPSFRSALSRELAHRNIIPALDKRLRGKGCLAYDPYQEVFLRSCSSVEERAQMLLYMQEVGVEYIGSTRFLGDGEISCYALRDLYTLQPLWPQSTDRLKHAADPVLDRISADRDRFRSNVDSARARSIQMVRSEGEVLRSVLGGVPDLGSPSAKWRLLGTAFRQFARDLDGVRIAGGAVKDLEPFLSIPVANGWVLVAYFQRVATFSAMRSGATFDIQTALTREEWFLQTGGAVPIPYGVHKLYLREAIHGFRSAYLGAGTVEEILAAVWSYSVAIEETLSVIKDVIGSLSAHDGEEGGL